MNATPRPWQWHKQVDQWPTVFCDIELTADRPVAQVFGPNYPDGRAEETSKANAELIVRAVNSYDAMRTILQRIAVLMDSGDLPGKEWVEYTQIQAALKLAEGG